MFNRFKIVNGNLVLPDRVVKNGTLVVENGKITSVNEICHDSIPAVDAKGGYILPGFIDIHVHGGGGSDLMDANPDDLNKMLKIHCEHGTTAIVPTTMTCSDELLERVIINFNSYRKKPHEGSEILGLHLEGPFFSQSSKGAQNVTEERKPDRGFLEYILKLGEGTILRWDAAPELPGMEMFAGVMRENGVIASIAHSGCHAQTAMKAFDWGFSHVTHFYNAVTTFYKKDGLLYSGIIEATYLRDDITIELIGDGRHIPRESMLLALKIKGADKIALITDAMRSAGTDSVYSMLGDRINGTPVVIKDDVAQLRDLSFYAGSVGTMDRSLRTAHVDYGIPLNEVSRMLSLTPARLSGVDCKKGSLEAGKDADIVIMDKDFEIQAVYVNGMRRV